MASMDPTNDDVTYESVAHDDGLHIDGHGTDDESTTQLDLHSFSGDDVTTKDININTDGDMTEPIESNTNINQEVFSDDISRYSQDGQPGHESGDSDSKQGEGPLEDFDWAHLEHRFQTVMQQKQDEEAKIQEELARLVQFYDVWASTAAGHEYDRAAKRLRTRIAYVRNEEVLLAQKRKKHEEVVRAFQTALAMLETLGG